MYIAFNAPHDPRQSPKEFVDMYPLDKISVSGNFMAMYQYAEEIGSGKTLRDERLAPFSQIWVRGSYITGRNPFTYGIYWANQGFMMKEEITIAEVLHEFGCVLGGVWLILI